MNDKYTYEVTDTGKYFYENNVRIFPEQFWHIIKKLEHKIEELDFELKQCKERKLYSRRELEKENKELKLKINTFKEGNKTLQERNDRQAKQLDNIYNLIEKQDWETLQGLIEEFKECEEQLKVEMECYE